MLEVPYRKTTNEYLRDRGSTKSIVSINGRIYVECRVESVKNGSLLVTTEIGEASGNMKAFDLHFNGAIYNAIKKHEFKKQVSGARVTKIYDYWIKYFNDEVEVKRKHIKPDVRVVEVKPYTRIIPRRVKETKDLKVRGYVKSDGTKVKGYTRRVTKEYTIYEEKLVSGYTYKQKVGRGTYKNVVKFKGEEILRERYKRRSVERLNDDLYGFNKSLNNAQNVDRI